MGVVRSRAKMDAAEHILFLPRARGRWRAKRAGRGKYRHAQSKPAPSTMLRMVPLPRFAGADEL